MSAGSDSVAGVLEGAADRLSKPGAWMQGDLARDARGNVLKADSIDSGVCFCAAGALWAEAHYLGEPRATTLVFAAFNALRPVIDSSGVGSWNDAPERTQAEVVAKLREVAALAKERGQ